MSHEVLTEIIGKASKDEIFRAQLIENAAAAIEKNKWDLTENEIKALCDMKFEKLESNERCLDERVSKALYGTDTHSILW